MNPVFTILASVVPELACCLAAAVIVLVGAPSRLKALGGAGALMMVAAEATQLVVYLSPHDGIGWLWIPQVVSLFFVAGLVMLAVAATSPAAGGATTRPASPPPTWNPNGFPPGAPPSQPAPFPSQVPPGSGRRGPAG
ncbi:hypothetical protein [Acidipropionibacterium virtanenii]|uniref:Uncharacterized protein n=1 Tax=Acidipropionibacterium virtanenii TaxID=2057246 RepID=A0A344UQ47_9ACTN|nr:hypothetical protein [Acidipropionibacterium virtanenii]AXE37395.1 hypothetical protein JS278_00198 [Acidipropionibacterium virtanenii]